MVRRGRGDDHRVDAGSASASARSPDAAPRAARRALPRADRVDNPVAVTRQIAAGGRVHRAHRAGTGDGDSRHPPLPTIWFRRRGVPRRRAASIAQMGRWASRIGEGGGPTSPTAVGDFSSGRGGGVGGRGEVSSQARSSWTVASSWPRAIQDRKSATLAVTIVAPIRSAANAMSASDSDRAVPLLPAANVRGRSIALRPPIRTQSVSGCD